MVNGDDDDYVDDDKEEGRTVKIYGLIYVSECWNLRVTIYNIYTFF